MNSTAFIKLLNLRAVAESCQKRAVPLVLDDADRDVYPPGQPTLPFLPEGAVASVWAPSHAYLVADTVVEGLNDDALSWRQFCKVLAAHPNDGFAVVSKVDSHQVFVVQRYERAEEKVAA